MFIFSYNNNVYIKKKKTKKKRIDLHFNHILDFVQVLKKSLLLIYDEYEYLVSLIFVVKLKKN